MSVAFALWVASWIFTSLPPGLSALRARQDCYQLLTAPDIDKASDYWRLGERKKAEGDAEKDIRSKQASYRCALAAYESSTILAPRDPRGFFYSGQIYFELHQFNAAAEAYHEALKRRRSFPEANLGLARIYIHFGNFAQASFHLERELKENPKNESAWLAKGNLALARQDFLRAASCFGIALVLNPGNQDTYLSLAIAERKARRFDAALSTFRALEALPGLRVPEFYVEKGILMQKRGQFKEAIGAFQAYLDLGGLNLASNQIARENLRKLSAVSQR